VAPEPYLDLSDAVAGGFERGLLGLAFHPGFADNGRFFVDYTRGHDGATVVSEFVAADGVADAASERELLIIEQPFANHNGGMIAFDAGGLLLIGTGDGGSGGDPNGNSQNPDSLLGKLLRIDVDGPSPYGIPADNGYASTDAHRPEIHVKGLRNPWRFSVDELGGHIYIGDVGQNRWEEINVLPGGRGGVSFGWNALEGPECFVAGCNRAAHVSPTLAYRRDDGCAVVGGYVYRGTLQAELEGIYLFGDFCSGTIWGVAADAMLDGPTEAKELGQMDGTLTSFGVDDAGEVYAVDRGGRVLHVRAVPLS
jgi:glucose/arabinose dehydrogenase